MTIPPKIIRIELLVVFETGDSFIFFTFNHVTTKKDIFEKKTKKNVFEKERRQIDSAALLHSDNVVIRSRFRGCNVVDQITATEWHSLKTDTSIVIGGMNVGCCGRKKLKIRICSAAITASNPQRPQLMKRQGVPGSLSSSARGKT